MKKPVLNDITVEITNHCQLHCQHCGIWAEKERHEMTASLVVRMIRNLTQEFKLKFVSVTGGEPFLNRNCGRLLKSLALLRERGDIDEFGVYSNAAYFEGVRRVFTAYGPYLKGMYMGISIDGGPKTHDLLRGEGAYQKTLKTMGWLHDNYGQKITLDFKFTINQMNFAEIHEVYQLARRYKARFFPKIMESGVSDYYHRHEMPQAGALSTLTPAMIEVVRRQISQILDEGYAGVDRKLTEAMLILLEGGRDCIRACATPARSLFINSRRKVYPCLYMEPAGQLGSNGELPQALNQVRRKLSQEAAQGHCPGCFAYHGFLKKFNLDYLQAPGVLSDQPR